ncbi:helix-turn-helix domain-containing protein [Mucilaginibacter arboris]|uniref:Helix-turn-helix domain-containing protein n=1 Tax=Mucilaginibacter arboris TaxID=2682090 RepID=A0A7K1T078_9SPHI|nr:helix-turn-helix transcriptional regulator [Mucilaginibacter arboris]MVN22971.1 helix-turn-helix domain-containing protein [Mucilaginibacter arboris]
MGNVKLKKKLKMLRYNNGWSQEQVSTALDISIPAYSKIETGITDINLSRLEQIAGLYNLNVVQLLTEEDPQDFKEVVKLKNQLRQRDEEIMALQRELIRFYRWEKQL